MCSAALRCKTCLGVGAEEEVAALREEVRQAKVSLVGLKADLKASQEREHSLRYVTSSRSPGVLLVALMEAGASGFSCWLCTDIGKSHPHLEYVCRRCSRLLALLACINWQLGMLDASYHIAEPSVAMHVFRRCRINARQHPSCDLRACRQGDDDIHTSELQLSSVKHVTHLPDSDVMLTCQTHLPVGL